MAFEVKMPQLGLTMEEGTVARWIKHEGDAVKVGDVLLEITTDKLTNEVTSEYDGVLLKIVAQEGEDVPVKGLLAYIGQPGEAVGGAAPAAAAPAAGIAAPPGALLSGADDRYVQDNQQDQPDAAKQCRLDPPLGPVKIHLLNGVEEL